MSDRQPKEEDSDLSLDLTSLRRRYAEGALKPTGVVDAVWDRIKARGDDAAWITLVPRAAARERARQLEADPGGPSRLPLFGVPFSVKDNIDAAGMPTTAACPEFAYVPARNAPVVERLLAAGAILVGKNNLDQFATGLVGTRSPYGTPRNPFDAGAIPGGSSSGSAVAVAAGLVSFALATDTAGSGRVPAGFNNLVGYKPTLGLISTRGVVPACRSLDCVSLLTLTCADAVTLARLVCAADPENPWSRPDAGRVSIEEDLPGHFRFGVPGPADLETFGDAETGPLFAAAVARLTQMGGRSVEIDFAPFREVARMLYEGPWVAERLAAFRDFLDKRPGSFLPLTRSIFEGGRRFSAADAFAAKHRLEALRLRVRKEWDRMDVLLVPTTGTTYTLAQVEAKPIELNSNLGYYTNFVNLLDCCALAVPSGFRGGGLPFGVTLVAPALRDGLLLALGAEYQRRIGGTLGATRSPLPPAAPPRIAPVRPDWVRLAVLGAHLAGMPLNHQLTERGARLVRCTQTKPCYRLFALPGTQPPKPGLVRCAAGGAVIDLEVWEMPLANFGGFVALVPRPLAIGTLDLQDGESVQGFLCEDYAVAGAADISRFGGWRGYLLNCPDGRPT